MPIVLKYLITAGMVVLVSELAKRSDKIGALVASLPLVTFMVLIWLHLERQSAEKINNHAFYTFWYVMPTLPMFLVFPWLNQQFGFWLALLASALLTAGLFVVWSALLRPFGIEL